MPVVTNRLRRGGAGVLLWGAPAILLFVHFAVTGRHDALLMALQFCFALVLAVGVVLSPATLVRASLVALLSSLLLAGSVSPFLVAFTWDDGADLSLPAILRRLLPHHASFGERSFGLASDGSAQRVSVAFDAVAPPVRSDTGWLRSHATYLTSAHVDDEGRFTRVVAPEVEGAYLRKVFQLGSATGGATLRATWELRSSTPFVPEPCRGVMLHTGVSEVGREGVRCHPVQPTTAWHAYEVVWSPPASVTDARLNFDLRGLEGVTFDVRRVTLQRLTPSGWAAIGPAIPDAPYLSVATQEGMGRPSQVALLAIRPAETPSSYRTETIVPASADRIVAKLHPGADESTTDASTVVRSLAVHGADGRRLRSIPPADVWTRRQSLLFGHPNLAGHAAAVTGIGATLSVFAPAAAVVVAGATIAVIWATGSRAALGGFLIGLVLLWVVRVRSAGGRGGRGLAWLGAVLLVVGVLLASGAGRRLGSLDDETLSVRVAIWQASARAFLDAPWTGSTPSARSALYDATPTIAVGSAVGHAHNLGLELASLYGAYGVAVAAWVSAGLLLLAWRWGGGAGLAVLVPIGLGQSVDATLFTIGVLLPTILALDLLRRRPARGLAAVAPTGAGGTGTE